MQIVKLYDGNNFFRMMVEKDQTSLAPRRLYQEMAAETGALHIWTWDGKGSRAARQAIWPDYKTKRKPAANDIYASLDFFRELLGHSTAYQITIPGFEADDVIKALTDHYLSMGSPQVQIYTNDLDLMALAAGRETKVIGGWNPKEGVAADEVHTFKVWCGDPSDCIPGVKGFGLKSWEAADHKILRAISLACIREKPLDDLLKNMWLSESRGQESIKAWVQENQSTIAAMHQCVDFIPVPPRYLVEYMKRPIHDPAKIEASLRQFLL